MFCQNKLSTLTKYLLAVFLFFLPFQTRWIYHYGNLNNGFWEYGTAAFYGTEILLWLAVLMFAANNFFNKEFWQKVFSKNNKNNGKFIFCCLLGGILVALLLAKSSNFDVSYDWFFHLLEAWCVGMMFFLINNSEAKNSTTLPLFLFSFWLGGLLQAGLAITQFFTQNISANKWLGMAIHNPAIPGTSVIEFVSGRFLRAYGSFGWPNSLGIYLTVSWLVGILIFLKIYDLPAKSKIFNLKNLIIVGELLIILGLFLSWSRAAWLAVTIGLLVFCGLEFYKNKTNLKKLIPLLVSSTVLVLLLVIIFKPILFARLDLNNRLETRSIAERISQYSYSLEILPKYLWLGTGAGNYTWVLAQSFPMWQPWEYQPVHNIFVLSLVELGILGALMYWLISLFIIKKIWQNNPAGLGIVAALLVFGLFDHWLFSLYTGVVFFWVILALVLSKKL